MTFRSFWRSIGRDEWRFVGGLALLALALASISLVVISALTPSGYFATGFHTLSPGDYPVYYSYIDQASHGALLFSDLFTLEPHQPFNLNVFWVPVGWAARLLDLTPPVAFHLARLLMIPLFFAVVYPLLALLFDEVRRRKAALVFIVFASGLGGYFALPYEGRFPEGVSPMEYPHDLWVTEAFPFLQFHQTGHFTFGTILFMLVLAGTLLAWRTGRLRYSLGAGLAGLWLFAFHPFHAPSLAAILTVWAIWEGWRRRSTVRRILFHSFVVLFVASGSFLAQLAIASANPIGIARAAQNTLLTQPWPIVLEGYGFLAVGALWLIVRRSTWRDDRRSLVALWAIAHGLIIFAPLFFQRRLMQGLSIPLAILTADAVVWVLDRWRARQGSFRAFVATSRVVLVFCFLLLFGFSSLIVLGQDIHFVLTNRTAPFVMYLPRVYDSAFAALRQGEPGASILGRAGTGNVLPGFTGRPTYVGHPVETAEFELKRSRAEWFFQQSDAAGRRQFLKEIGVRYVFWGPLERSGSGLDLRSDPGLTPIFDQADVTVFRVDRVGD